MIELNQEEMMSYEGGHPVGDVLITVGSGIVGYAIGGPAGAVVGVAIGLLGVASNIK